MKSKSKVKQYINQNEVVRDLPGAVAKSLKDDLAEGVVSGLWNQMLGVEVDKKGKKTPNSGDLKPGEELNLQKRAEFQRAEPGIDYAREIIQGERKIRASESHEIKFRIQEIQVELKKLTKTSRELEIEFKDIALETMPVNPGKFHLNFFEWVLSQIRRARMRIEDSAHWVTTMRSKKSQRQYWNLFKKHGTSFGLSGERIVATQTG